MSKFKDVKNFPFPKKYKNIITSFIEGLVEGDLNKIQCGFDEILKNSFDEEMGKYESTFKQMSLDCGKFVEICSPIANPPTPPVYKIIFPLKFERCILNLKIDINNKNKISGFRIEDYIPLHERNMTKLDLPFEGPWFVYWGGDKASLNHHHNIPNQRFAFDFIIFDRDQKTYKENSKIIENYYAFGRPIYAPAEGFVTDIINGVRDNSPRSLNPYSALGNAVFIQHQEYEVSIIAHFKCNSILVNVGDSVRKGVLLGLCGNSGNSSEPHIHYQLDNANILQKGIGIKCYFENLMLIKNDKKEFKKEYSPIKGDIIERVKGS